MMDPRFIDTIFAFSLSIVNHWIPLAGGGLAAIILAIVSRCSRHSALMTRWASDINKPFWTTPALFVSFILASFLACSDEHTVKLAAVYKMQSTSGVVMTREITSGASYTARESDYMLVFDLPTNSKFKLYLLPNPPEGRKFEIKNEGSTVDLTIGGNGHLIDGHPHYVLVNPDLSS